MNINETIELYLHGESTVEQNKKLLEWLQENDDNIRLFIREAHDSMALTEFFNAEDFIRGKIDFPADCSKNETSELDIDELKKAAGGTKEDGDLKPRKDF